jgi:hypothetical protein
MNMLAHFDFFSWKQLDLYAVPLVFQKHIIFLLSTKKAS